MLAGSVKKSSHGSKIHFSAWRNSIEVFLCGFNCAELFLYSAAEGVGYQPSTGCAIYWRNEAKEEK